MRRLIELMGDCPHGVEDIQHPTWQLQRLRKEAMQLARDKHLRVTQYVTERICPMAEHMIKKLHKEDSVDLRWTRSPDPARALCFEGDELERENALRRWERAENHKKRVEKPWIGFRSRSFHHMSCVKSMAVQGRTYSSGYTKGDPSILIDTI